MKLRSPTGSRVASGKKCSRTRRSMSWYRPTTFDVWPAVGSTVTIVSRSITHPRVGPRDGHPFASFYALRERPGLADAAVQADGPHRPPGADDLEPSQGVDPREPAAEHPRLGRARVHHQQEAVPADPLLRPAPLREAAGVAGMVAEHGHPAGRGEGDLAAVVPVAGEQERPGPAQPSPPRDPSRH